jgi:hypothetical protein
MEEKMNADKIDEWKERLEEMSLEELVRLKENAPDNHPVFDGRLPLNAIFEKRVAELSREKNWVKRILGRWMPR